MALNIQDPLLFEDEEIQTAYGSAHSDIAHRSRELQALASPFEEVGNYPEGVREGETTGHRQDRQRPSGRRRDVLAEKVKKELIEYSNSPGASRWPAAGLSSTPGSFRHDLVGGLEPDQAANPLQLQYGEAERFRSESFTPSTVGDFNEGRYTTASLEAGYNAVKAAADMSTTKALKMCTRYVLYPFHIFLKVIGWRSFRSKYATSQPLYKKIANVVYPTFIFFMLLVTSFSQVLSCFFRNREMPPLRYGVFYILDCSNNVVTGIIVSYFLILGVYAWALYIFRYTEFEHLASLSETAFLSFNNTEMNKSRNRPVFVLLSFLFGGILWIIFSLGASVLRLFALQLDEHTTIIGWFTSNLTSPDQHSALRVSFDVYNILHYLFAIVSIVGFIFFDLLYVAVVINYCSQCQLLIYYINNIKEKVQDKKYLSLTEAAKDLNKMSEFLSVLNSTSSYITTLILYIFVRNIITSYAELVEDEPGDDIASGVGFVNIIQWLVAAAFPIIMASRLTSVGVSVRRLGMEIAARPFVYSETPDLELDIFLNFTSSTCYEARLSFVPMHPALVGGFVFVIVVLLTSHVGIPGVRAVTWF